MRVVAVPRARSSQEARPGLDDRTTSLIRLGALIATGACPASYEQYVAVALAAGATEEDLLNTLVSVAPIVGMAHLVTATPWLALAMGYDIDAALEEVGIIQPGR